jgi:hypothetical protein
MKRRITFLILSCIPFLALSAVSCGGGGGGGGGGTVVPTPIVATFTPVAPAGDMSMDAGASSGSDFTVEVRVNGPIDNFFGVGFRVALPANVQLLPGSFEGTFLGSDSPPGGPPLFSAVQVGNQVLVQATRVQPNNGFDPGLTVTGSELLATLRFRATAATTGAMPYTNQEFRTCDTGTSTCPEETRSWSGGSLVAN